MVPLGQWLLFAATALLMVLTSGPNTIHLIARSISQGWRTRTTAVRIDMDMQR